MKLSCLLVGIFCCLLCNGQSFFVSKVVGKVFNGGVPVKAGDQLDSITRLTSVEQSALVRLVNNTTGTFVISFYEGKVVSENPATKLPELYELVIKDYFEKYRKYKSLSGKDFVLKDWFDCLVATSQDSSNNHLLIITDEKLALHTKNFNPDQKFSLVACPVDKSIACLQIPEVKDSFYFPSSLFGKTNQVQLKFYISESQLDKDTLAITDNTVNCVFLSKTAIADMINQFLLMENDSHKTRGTIGKELYDFIKITFGAYFSPYIDELVNLAKSK